MDARYARDARFARDARYARYARFAAPPPTSKAGIPAIRLAVLSAVLVVLCIVVVWAWLASGTRAFSGRTDPFWTPHTTAPPTRRLYDAASGPDGGSVRSHEVTPWAETYWPPVGPCPRPLARREPIALSPSWGSVSCR